MPLSRHAEDFLYGEQSFLDSQVAEERVYQFLSRMLIDKTMTPQKAAEQVLASEELLTDIASYLLELCTRTDRKNHAKLAAFLLALYKCTDHEPFPAQVEIWYEWWLSNASWRIRWCGFEDPLEEVPEEARHWENYFAFCARLSDMMYAEDPVSSEKPTTWEARPWIDMTYVLRPPLQSVFGSPNPRDVTKGIMSEHATRVGCWSLILNSRQIWAYCKAEYNFDGVGASRRALPEWHLGLWRQWKQGIVEAQSMNFGQDTKRLLDEALAEMNRIDAEDVVPATGGKWW